MTAFITLLETLAAGKAGHIAASTGPTGHSQTLVRLVDANINAGLGVTPGTTAGKSCKAPASRSDVRNMLGILIDPEFHNDTAAAADYLAGNQATILEVGYIWVNAEATVAIGDDVYCRFTSDGASNTTLGTFRPDNDTPSTGIVITPTASPVQTTTGGYTVRLRDKAGHDETFVYDADSTATVGEIAAGLVALIDASPNFAATGTVTVTVTTQAGTGQVEVLQIGEHLTVTTDSRAECVRGAKFASAVTGAGLAMVRLAVPPTQARFS